MIAGRDGPSRNNYSEYGFRNDFLINNSPNGCLGTHCVRTLGEHNEWQIRLLPPLTASCEQREAAVQSLVVSYRSLLSSTLRPNGPSDSHNAIRVIQYQTLQFARFCVSIAPSTQLGWPVVNHADQQVSFEGKALQRPDLLGTKLGSRLVLLLVLAWFLLRITGFRSSGHVSWVCYTNSIVCWFRLVGVVSVFLNFSSTLLSPSLLIFPIFLFLSHFSFRATC